MKPKASAQPKYLTAFVVCDSCGRVTGCDPCARCGSPVRLKYEKFRRVRTEYNGRVYDSKAEAVMASMLDAQERSGELRQWWPQVPLAIKLNGTMICKLVLDFQVLYADDDDTEFIEVKGYETAVWKLKHKLFRAMYPNTKLTVINVASKAGTKLFKRPARPTGTESASHLHLRKESNRTLG